jgi:hypothetical protein
MSYYYLDHLPGHARLIVLVLSLLTGYALSQFHLKHDDFFETNRDLKVLPKSKWRSSGQWHLEGLCSSRGAE